jgi:short-subunit dehydrogenase
VALVTGASSGIGRSIALKLAESGHDLVVTARRPELLEALAEEVRSRYGRQVESIVADLRDRSDLAVVARRVEAGVDILVANAGFSSRGFFPDLPLRLEIGQIELNVLSTVVLCHAAAGAMSKRGSGRILITSSAASFQPLPGLATYGATKAFLTSFAQALDAELRLSGVTVSCLAPGFTETDPNARRHSLPWLWRTSDQVAQAAVDGLLTGRPLIVPGLAWRAIAVLAPRAPRFLVRRIARNVGRGMLRMSPPEAPS